MRIMVLDVAAESGGALTILMQYYNNAIVDMKNEWLFVVSFPNLNETGNVKVLKYPWVKRSWFHRLFFDDFIAHKLVDKFRIDKIISLQNLGIPKTKVKQVLYLHQALPFIEKKYTVKENLKFWIYQNVLSKMIYKSINQAEQVIVQTNWMKDACVNKTNATPNKIVVVPPSINIQMKSYYNQEDINQKLFFYPANSFAYKNHRIIVEAIIQLQQEKIFDYKIVFTLKGNENKNISELYNIVKKLNLSIEFVGVITLEEVYNYYSKAILLFPSYLESFGLPMLEAKMHNTPILASDCAFSHEILDGYEKVKFFYPYDYMKLSEVMKEVLNNEW